MADTQATSVPNPDVNPPRGGAPGFGSFETGPRRGGAPAPRPAPRVDDAPSVVDENSQGGAANLTAGVVRRRVRTIRGLVGSNVGGAVSKNYRVSDAVLFNNIDELFQDKISREYAQEIIEDFFDKCGVDTSDPQAARYAEDVLFVFLVATTASDKADYDKSIPVPSRRGATVDLNMQVLSKLLASEYGVTRRAFARGVADDLRKLLRAPENTHFLPLLATRVGCDVQFSHLAFDGSTHCTGMTSREVAFTKTLESRNLFESDDVLAAGASERLMQGMPVASRATRAR